jgi:hypothetical protein
LSHKDFGKKDPASRRRIIFFSDPVALFAATGSDQLFLVNIAFFTGEVKKRVPRKVESPIRRYGL